MSKPGGDSFKDVEWYRERAEEILAIRSGMTDPLCRHTLAIVAANWSTMADQIERMLENEKRRTG